MCIRDSSDTSRENNYRAMSIVKGKLKFKGGFEEKVKREEKKIKHNIEKEKEREEPAFQIPEKKEVETIEFPVQSGSGRIITSGKTVHGKDTLFSKELQQFDKIIILHPTTLVKEERIIQVILSDRSLGIDEPFSSDLITYTQYEFQKKPVQKEADETLEEKYDKKLKDLSKKIVKDKSVLEFREKTGMWGYKVIKEQIEGKRTNEELLDMRAKKGRDKFCWIQHVTKQDKDSLSLSLCTSFKYVMELEQPMIFLGQSLSFLSLYLVYIHCCLPTFFRNHSDPPV
eukprot:TRINITY_DN1343_c0_g1_i12.p1 TRINITY_DN1343_c0_g1~~TRINITY_DN1343_c0_g1_i12.p1  ORF type:complete len:323 (+),score=88.67 TRINITY_DN1343_c0_g1_i12:116-970(+)